MQSNLHNLKLLLKRVQLLVKRYAGNQSLVEKLISSRQEDNRSLFSKEQSFLKLAGIKWNGKKPQGYIDAPEIAENVAADSVLEDRR